MTNDKYNILICYNRGVFLKSILENLSFGEGGRNDRRTWGRNDPPIECGRNDPGRIHLWPKQPEILTHQHSVSIHWYVY